MPFRVYSTSQSCFRSLYKTSTNTDTTANNTYTLKLAWKLETVKKKQCFHWDCLWAGTFSIDSGIFISLYASADHPLSQNIIHSSIARVVYEWWALAYKLTTIPGSTETMPNHAIWRLRGSLDENVSFLCCLILSSWFDCIGILYSSIRIGKQPLRLPKHTYEVPDIQKSVSAVHAKLFFFSKPSTKMADVGKLLWAQTLYIVFVSASVPLIAIKRWCLQVSSTLRICVHCRTPFYIAPPFPVTSTFSSVNL